MKLKFTPCGTHFRTLCNETFEEQIFSSLPEAIAFCDRGRILMPDEPLSYSITRVTETVTEY